MVRLRACAPVGLDTWKHLLGAVDLARIYLSRVGVILEPGGYRASHVARPRGEGLGLGRDDADHGRLNRRRCEAGSSDA